MVELCTGLVLGLFAGVGETELPCILIFNDILYILLCFYLLIVY